MPAAANAADEEYAYELVTPGALEGNGVTDGSSATVDGNAVRFTSPGTLPGLPAALFYSSYVSRRTPTGWVPEMHTPRPPSDSPTLTTDAMSPFGVFSDLSGTFFNTAVALDPADQNKDAFGGGGLDVYLSRPDGTVQWLTKRAGAPDTGTAPDAVYGGQSPDGSTAVIQTSKEIHPTVPGGTSQVYAWRNGTLELVSEVSGATSGGAVLGGGTGPTADDYGGPRVKRAVSTDGRRIIFSTTANPRQVYVREDGTSTPVATLHRTDGVVPAAATATFQTASTDGRYVFFTTTRQLTDGAHATASVNGLYRYDLETDSMLLVSAGATGGVNSVVQASADGSAVAYIAFEASKQELYLWREGAPRQHVATLNSSLDMNDLWAVGKEGHHNGRLSPDGSIFVFAAKTKIGTFDTGIENQRQVYVWDAEAAELSCVSCRTDGLPTAKHAGGLFDLAQSAPFPIDGTMQARNVTDDGLLFFETTAPVDPADDDELSDVYVWDGERASLFSVGIDEDPAHFIDVTPDGSSVFFRTRATLTAWDTDRGGTDLYVARLGGGFPEPEPSADCGEAAECRGAGTPAPVPPAPGSVLHRPGNPPAAGPAVENPDGDGTKGAEPKLRKLTASDRSRWARTGRLSVKVTLAQAGAARVVARATIGGKVVTVASGKATLKQAGIASVTLRLSQAARRALRRSGKLSVRLHATGTSSTTGTSQTLVLRRAGAGR